MRYLEQLARFKPARLMGIAVFGVWLIKTLLIPVDSLADLPFSLFEPVGFLSVWPDATLWLLLQPTSLHWLTVATIVTLVLVLVDLGQPLAGVAACVLITLQQGLIRGFSEHVHHSDLVLLYAAYLLALFPAADLLARKQSAPPNRRWRRTRSACWSCRSSLSCVSATP